jgi:hypothetical protein
VIGHRFGLCWIGGRARTRFERRRHQVAAIADVLKDGWVGDVLKFWFEQTQPDQWFEKDPAFDASIRERFLGLHEGLVSRGNDGLLADTQTALDTVIMLDQISRNMFRATLGAFATDPQALWVAEAAIAGGFDAGLKRSAGSGQAAAWRGRRNRATPRRHSTSPSFPADHSLR